MTDDRLNWLKDDNSEDASNYYRDLIESVRRMFEEGRQEHREHDTWIPKSDSIKVKTIITIPHHYILKYTEGYKKFKAEKERGKKND